MKIGNVIKNNILITAGGTGGHVFPALSVAKSLIQSNSDVIWVGTKAGIENILVPKNNIKFITINMSGLRKKGILKLLKMPFLLCYAIIQSVNIILRHRPSVVVGFGGYVTFPVLFSAWLLRIPILLHEQNSVAGLSNKVLAKLANKVCVAFDGVLPSHRTIVVGNPVRQDILSIPEPKLRYQNKFGGLNILVIGGSLGAKIFNDTLPEVFKQVNDIGSITHQVGRSSLDEVKAKYASLFPEMEEGWLQTTIKKINLVSFIDDMATQYFNADLIICRSGALTVSEVCSAGIAAIFIPFPNAVDDHQWHNVQPLVTLGGAKVIVQSELTVNKLSNMINELSREDCLKMAGIARTLAIPNSTELICNIILNM